MAATAQEFADLLEPKLSNVWHDAYPARESVFPQIYNIRDMNKMTITDARLAGFGSLQDQAFGSPIKFDDPLSPETKSYTYSVRGLAYKVLESLWMNDLYGEVERFERDLMDAARDDTETSAASLLNNGFGTTNTGFDGLALFSASHTRMDGGAVQANKASTDEALSVSALQNALITIRKWKNERGRPRVHTPAKLVIPPDLMMTAYEILESDLHPENANNTKNVLTRFGLTPVIWNYLTSATAYFIVCDNHDLNFFWRFHPQSGTRTDWDTESIDRKVRQGYTYGFGQWQGIWGSDGV